MIQEQLHQILLCPEIQENNGDIHLHLVVSYLLTKDLIM